MFALLAQQKYTIKQEVFRGCYFILRLERIFLDCLVWTKVFAYVQLFKSLFSLLHMLAFRMFLCKIALLKLKIGSQHMHVFAFR